MKKLLFLSALLMCALVGCGDNTPPKNAVSVANTLTEDTVTEMFTDNSGYRVTDCALVTDSAYDLIGVVQFDDEDGSLCNLAFIEEDGNYQRVGFDSRIADGSVLTYIGDGAVSLSLTDTDSGEAFTHTVRYSNDGAGKVHFEANSKHK